MYVLTAEAVIPTQTDVFHRSRHLNALLDSGEFDPTKSNHEGVMFFTLSPSMHTNCLATVTSPLKVYKPQEFTPDEQLLYHQEVDERGWDSMADAGYDGIIYSIRDAFTLVSLSPEVYADELIVFARSLLKIGHLRKA